MTEIDIPPMEPLAPIVDRMREIAHEEIPSPRTCRVKLWDDGTFRAYIYNKSGDEYQGINYERTTGEVVRIRMKQGDYETATFAGGETLYTPTYDEYEVRTITTVEPPYR